MDPSQVKAAALALNKAGVRAHKRNDPRTALAAFKGSSQAMRYCKVSTRPAPQINLTTAAGIFFNLSKQHRSIKQVYLITSWIDKVIEK